MTKKMYFSPQPAPVKEPEIAPTKEPGTAPSQPTQPSRENDPWKVPVPSVEPTPKA